jgi:hypothetical protein
MTTSIAERILGSIQTPSSTPPKELNQSKRKIEESNPGSANVVGSSAEARAKEYARAGIARVSYSKKLRRVTLQRYLASKIVYHPEKVTYSDILVLYDNLLSLQDLAQRDPGFQEKFGIALEAIAVILKGHRFSERTMSTGVSKLQKEFRDQLQGFTLPERNLQGTERHLRGHYQVLAYRESGKPNSEIPPKPYIGVGYNDKGHYTDQAYDGSPHWTEVIKGGVE